MAEQGLSVLTNVGALLKDSLQALCLGTAIAQTTKANLNEDSSSESYYPLTTMQSLMPGSDGGLMKKTYTRVSPTEFSMSPLHAVTQLLVSSMCILPPNVRLEFSLAGRFRLLFLVTTLMNISGALTVPSDQILTA